MGSVLGLTGLLIATQPSRAQTRPATVPAINIPPSPLVRALRAFSRQTGRQVAAPSHLVRGKTATAVTGRLEPDAALDRLLRGTGLTFRAAGGGYVLAPRLTLVAPARTATLPPADPAAVERDIIIVGTRLGDGDATDVKRRALQSISVLTADAIRSAPDTSLADIVRRIPGVQLSVRAGGGVVSIRGLSQTEDRLNGRNLTSTGMRGFDIAALPSDIVSGVDVYKTPSASQIEGGIGGVIDFHTRRPFDAVADDASLTARAAYGNLDDRVRPYVSGHVSVRRPLGSGEVGVLAGGSHQAHDIGGDIFRTDTNRPQARPGGDIVDAPADVAKRYLRGIKALTAGYVSAQWRSASAWEVIGDLLVNRSDLDFANTSLTADLASGRIAAAGTGRSGDAAVRAGEWAGVPLTATTSRGVGYLDARQFGLGARYRQGPVTLLVEGSRTGTAFRYGAASVALVATAPALSYAAAGGLPRFTVAGIDPGAADAWRAGRYGDVALREDNAETAFRADGIYAGGGIVESVKAGVRFARRSFRHRQSLQSADAPDDLPIGTAGITVSRTAARLFDPGYPQPAWVAPTVATLGAAQVGSVRTLFGLPAGAPVPDDALSYDATEAVANGYGEATFGVPVAGLTIQGNAGLRYAATDLTIGGPATAVTKRRYDHWLPSVNLRTEPVPGLLVRLGWSRQITRPSFGQLAPTTSVDFVNATGDAGNPTLRALQATQYDAALEWYFGHRGQLYAATFYKDVTGFIRMQAAPEVVRGRVLLVSRPYNADRGWIGGVETGFSRRLDFLPGPLSGLGVQASYTRIASFRTDNGAGYRVPLEQMSRHNYAIAGSYDGGGVEAGIAWIWRSRLLQVSRGDALGRPLYRDPYGQLDASLRVAVSPRVSVSAGIINALRRRTTEYFGDPHHINQVFVESRRILVGMTLHSGSGP